MSQSDLEPEKRKSLLKTRKQSKRAKNFLKKGSNIECRRSTNGMTLAHQAVLLTGGLVVKKEGTVMIKREGLVNQYKKKFLSLEHGILKIYSLPAKIKKQKSKHNAHMPKDPSWKLEDKFEIVQIRDLKYEKRNSRELKLIFRVSNNVRGNRASNRSKGSRDSKHFGNRLSLTSKTSKYSRVSRAMATGETLRKTSSQRHFSLRNALNWTTSADRTLYLKADGKDADHWAQAILYELRNQASALRSTIETAQDISIDRRNLDTLHRQHVDLWALAKGKVSEGTRDALQSFVGFLESDSGTKEEESEPDFYEELPMWKDTLKLVEELLANNRSMEEEKIKFKSGLEELQHLNESEEHGGPPDDVKETMFMVTTRFLSEDNKASRRSSTAGGFLGLGKRRKHSKQGRNIELDDIEVVPISNGDDVKVHELELVFKSAVDVGREKENKEELKLIQKINLHNATNRTQLQELQSP